MNNQHKKGGGGIGWTDYTWNPVTGCHNDCSYCYARKIGLRFKGHFIPTFYPDRLTQPYKAKPSKIFVCSMADLFAPWIPRGWISQIIKVAKDNPQHTFQFLTKYPLGYKRIRKYPKNCWLGETITHFRTAPYDVSPYTSYQNRVRFVSFEPLMTRIELSVNFPHDWIIIGAMTGDKSHHHQPKREWIEYIVWKASQKRVPVFMKSNLQGIWGKKLIQEWPK